MSIYQTIEQLGIILRPVAAPVAAYASYVQAGDLLFISGHLAKQDGKPVVGQLGANISVEQGRQYARETAIDLLSTLQVATGNDLTKVKQIVRLTGLVNSTNSFTEHHLVIDGASQLLQQVFKTPHSRCAYGVAQIPLGACLEIDLIVQLVS